MTIKQDRQLVILIVLIKVTDILIRMSVIMMIINYGCDRGDEDDKKET